MLGYVVTAMQFLWFKETLALLMQVVEEEKIDCDLWRGRVFGSQEI
jgi:hypothetical protein